MYVYPNIILTKEPRGLNRFLAERTLLSRAEMKRQNKKVLLTTIGGSVAVVAGLITLGSLLNLAVLFILAFVLGFLAFLTVTFLGIDISIDTECHDGCSRSVKLLLRGKKKGQDYVDVDHSAALDVICGSGTSGYAYGAFEHPHRENARRTWCNEHRADDDLVLAYLTHPQVLTYERLVQGHLESKDPEEQAEIAAWKAELKPVIDQLFGEVNQRKEVATAATSAERDMWLVESRANREVLSSTPKEIA